MPFIRRVLPVALVTFFMQRELHYSPLRTGLGFLPRTLNTIAVGWRPTPLLMRRIPARTRIVIGAALAAAGFVWQSRMTAESGHVFGILAPAVVFTVGGGLFNTPLTTTALPSSPVRVSSSSPP